MFTKLFLNKMPCVRKRGLTQPKIYGTDSKDNHFIYTLVCIYMLNIMILAKTVFQILCSQSCSYTICLFPKKRSNSIENLRNRLKIELNYLHFGLYLYAKYKDPSLKGSSDILFTRLFLYKMPMPVKGE